MRIVFVCGCLEPGNDGVGDYTRRLAAELIRQGHTAGILALHEPGREWVFSGQQFDEQIPVPVLRLSQCLSWPERMRYAQAWVAQQNPEVLSLQYVPFSYDAKGLPWGLAGQLKTLGKNVPWHVMFHEIWVGTRQGSSVKQMLWGSLQQAILRRLVKQLAPQQIHTQSQLYQAFLARQKVQAGLLPLFGNVPLQPQPFRVNTHDYLEIIVFGTVHADALWREAIQELSQQDRPMRLTFIGRNGSHAKACIEWCTQMQLPVRLLGEQALERISFVLSQADIGLTSTALPMVEKSGTVAAMLEHGLPVLCIASAWQPRGVPSPPLPLHVYAYRVGQVFQLLDSLQKHPPKNRIARTAEQLTRQLSPRRSYSTLL
ncbi:glycosyltransferase [Siphonobacter curvatus]|uniref:Glycosyltransferase subfamily 4-like N-terminal domain-containing protein n=1 Tax=Siphonobacter curvatus TaxID=2094562 RepID=A0A2S7IEI4_9BACT|nr:glycosyltransferase [Siphonobacter curvatus]PQA53172.1 hypothetical protein C5O19_24910 [Siphonobacter curvatus]